MATTLASVNVRIGARIEELQKGLKKAERELLRSGRQLSRIGGDLTRSLTLPLAAAGGASLKFASDFEESFLKINTLVGVSGGVLDQFRDGIQNLSGPLGQSQQKLSEALFVITSAGQRGADALGTLEAASKASAIGLGNTADIARAAVAAQQAYGSEVLSSTAAVDKFTAIVRAGNLEAAELAPTIGKVLPLASQLGVSFDEVGANIATFTRLGVPAAESVTALRSLLSNLIKPSAQAGEELEKLGISADDLRKSVAENGLAATLQQLIKAYDGNTEGLAKLFGNVEGLANALGTAGAQGEDYLKIVDEIAKSNGIVNEGFEKVSETAGFKLRQSLVQLQNVGVQLGGTLIPVVTDLLDAVTPIIGAFSKLSPALQKAIVSSGLLVAAAGPAVSVFGQLKTVAGQVGLAYQSLTTGLSIAADTLGSTRAAIAATGGRLTALTGFTQAATAAWRSFNTVTKASVIGLTVAAVAALVAAMDNLFESTSSAGRAARLLGEVSKTAEQNIVAERVQAQQLIGVLADNKAKYDDKAAALQQLNAIAPQYFQGLSIEKSSVEDINAAYDKYVANLLKAARAQAAQEKIVELEKERLAVLEKISNPSLLDAAGAFLRGGAFGGGVAGDALRQLKAIDNQISALGGIATKAAIENAKLQQAAASTAAAPLNLNTPSTIASTGGGTPAAPSFAGFGSSLALINDNVQQSSAGITGLTNALKPLETQTNALTLSNQLAAQGLRELKEEYARIDKIREFQQALVGIAESGIESTLLGVSSAIAGVISGTASAGSVIGSVLNPILDMVEQLGKIAIGTGVAIGGIRKALQTLNPVAAIAAGVGLVALSKLVRSQLKNLVPAFATGGIVRQPTLALIGDNPGASSNYEAVLRRDQLQAIAADIAPSGGGGADYLPAFRLDGDTLLVWYERASAKRARRSG